jgi:hypothetical protein
MTDHPIAITDADDRGIPTDARCPCGWTWHRPDGDDYADTLPTASRAHHRDAAQLEQLEQLVAAALPEDAPGAWIRRAVATELRRPGPASIAPDLEPDGMVIHVYAVPSERLLLVSHLNADNVSDVGAVDADAAFAALYAGEDAVCIVAYDGDTGERSTFGWAPGPVT